jgi:hypothetical protein
VQLPYEVVLDGEWECALVELLAPITYMTLTGAELSMYIDGESSASSSTLTKIKVLNGHYTKIEDVLDVLNYACKAQLNSDTTVKFTVERNHVKVFVGGAAPLLYMNKKMAYILGFIGFQALEAGTHRGLALPDPRGGLGTYYVYCNVIEPQIVGNTMAPLLRVVPLKGDYGEVQSQPFWNLQYSGVLVKRFASIEISIKDGAGKPVVFSFGTVLTKLHFRRLSLL